MNNNIFKTLELIGAVTEKNKVEYSTKTRDMDPLTVFRDKVSGVIYIEDFYPGDDVYESGEYRKDDIGAGTPDYEALVDARRRALAYEQFFLGNSIAEFGCGAGDFLDLSRGNVKSCIGIELQEDYRKSINSRGIKCVSSLEDLEDSSIDVIFSFMVFEHLSDPLVVLDLMKKKLKKGGSVIIEVPHARDILLSQLDCEAFKYFTLWSQHLVLYTREAFTRLFQYAGYENIIVEGVQRYGLSNHLMWLATGLPAGHKSKLSTIDSSDLKESYTNALRKIDATDTIVLIANK